MINEKAVSKALLDQLRTVIGLPYIAVDNGKNYTPNPDLPYIRETDLPAELFSPTLNAGGYSTRNGIYQVDVCVQKNDGKWAALDYCALIQVAFPHALPLVADTNKLKIVSVSRGPSFSDATHYITPLSIRYEVVS